ncbi:MAG: class I SAM-dependent methyltransferase [Tepidisphaeraceae bacterium]
MSDQATADALMGQAAQSAREGRFPDAAQLLRRALAVNGSLAGGRHANLCEPLKRGADLENVVRLAPFRINALVTTGWLNSLFDGRPVDAGGRPIPWFTYPAIDFLEPRVQRNWTVLEWGCGNSTLWWAARTRHVIGVEHDRSWHQLIASDAPENAIIVLAENPDRYVNLQDTPDAGPYDAIVIDGERRNQCARRAASSVKPDGVIVFDNSDRKAYRDGLAFLMDSGWKRLDFFGLIPSYLYRGCTSIFYRDDAFLNSRVLPCDHQSCVGPTCAQGLGE